MCFYDALYFHSVMTSATWPPDVRDLGRRATNDPYLVVVGTLDLTVSPISPFALNLCHLQGCANVRQYITVCREEEKKEQFCKLLRKDGVREMSKIIVFVNSKAL